MEIQEQIFKKIENEGWILEKPDDLSSILDDLSSILMVHTYVSPDLLLMLEFYLMPTYTGTAFTGPAFIKHMSFYRKETNTPLKNSYRLLKTVSCEEYLKSTLDILLLESLM
jgi:hypothetical protein